MSRAVHMTKAQVEALRKAGRTREEGDVAASPPRVRSQRRVVKGEAYHTRCCTEGCGVEFHTVAAEDRHVKETGHARFQLVLGYS